MLRLLILFLTLTTCVILYSQSDSLSLKQTSQLDSVKAHYKGSIIFTAGHVSNNDFNADKILSKFDLKEESNLNAKIFLERPLSHYLSEINKEMTIVDLCNNGNYQFSFYVDQKLIYQQNLNTGAGTIQQKTEYIIVNIPLASTENEDSWGRYLWMRFMELGGGRTALSKGEHLLRIEIRPYLNLASETIIGEIIAHGNLNLNVVKPVATEEQIEIQEIAENSDWKLSTDEFDRDKIRDLNKLIAEKEFRQITSIVIIKENQLLLEEYFNKSHRDMLHNPRSVGKTFASAALGLAIQDGYIKSINQPISEFYNLKDFQNFSEAKNEVTIKDFLTMSSAFNADDDDYDSPGNEEYMYPTDDWVKFTLDLPMLPNLKNGQRWSYFTAGVVVLGDIIHHSVPGGLENYLHLKLMEPLGINYYEWQHTPQRIANTAGGIQLRALDFAKFGQLYKNKGLWNGNQVLSSEWVEASLGHQIKRSAVKGGGYYGYLFWNNTFTVDDKEYEVSYCTGNGGNKIFVFKDIPYVIVITAQAYNMPYAHPQVKRMMEEFILPAVLEE